MFVQMQHLMFLSVIAHYARELGCRLVTLNDIIYRTVSGYATITFVTLIGNIFLFINIYYE